ncbi:hypothetical protein V2S85_27110, partial [Novosphingobium resinovorum]|nr:hypothetical protein [Novosphingobium resinovorum]
AKSTPGMMEIGPNDALGAPRSLDVIKPARFARNYPVFAGLQLIIRSIRIILASFPSNSRNVAYLR